MVGQLSRIYKLILFWHCQHKHIQHLQAIMNPEAHNHHVAAAIVIKSSCKDSLATTRCSFEESSTWPPTCAKTLDYEFLYPRRKGLLDLDRVSGYPLSALVVSMCRVYHYLYTVWLYLHTQRDGLACYRATLLHIVQHNNLPPTTTTILCIYNPLFYAQWIPINYLQPSKVQFEVRIEE